MKPKIDLEKINWQKVAKYGACAVTGIMAFVSAVSDQKRDMEFESMKKQLSKLTEKES